jgi:carboxylesterase type B
MQFSSLALLGLLAKSSAMPTGSQTTVRASTGYYSGNVNKTFANVREFLNVPYGQDTGGENRWLPPKAVPMSSKHFDSTDYAKACPQYVTAVKNIYNQEVPAYLQYWGNPTFDAGEAAEWTTEDCLSLAIWTPLTLHSPPIFRWHYSGQVVVSKRTESWFPDSCLLGGCRCLRNTSS